MSDQKRQNAEQSVQYFIIMAGGAATGGAVKDDVIQTGPTIIVLRMIFSRLAQCTPFFIMSSILKHLDLNYNCRTI